jgi:hypothetical protein
MNTLLAALALLVATNNGPLLAKNDSSHKGKGRKATATASDPNTVVAKAHGGKVWILTGPGPSTEGEDLSKWLSSHPPTAEVAKKPGTERWPVNILAVFKKPPLKGAMTYQFVDKKDPKTLVAEDSAQSQSTSVVFTQPYDLEENIGFNKGHTYIIKVGQLIKKRFVTYATGEVSLK